MNFPSIFAALWMGCTVPLVAEKVEPPTDPVLVSLQAKLQQELKDLEPVVKIETPDAHAGKSLKLRYKTRTYQVYPSHRTGRLGKELQEDEGPDDEGVLVRVDVQQKGNVNQAVVPQTLTAPYWLTYLNVYPVEDTEKQLFLVLSYRRTTDKNLVSRIQRIVASHSGK